MANPHPTKSKPCKIGRKHTGKPSLRTIGRRKSKSLQTAKMLIEKIRVYHAEVSAYWRGEIDNYPHKTL